MAQQLQRMALLAPNSWNEETRTARIVISSDADVGDGIVLSHNPEAIRWPARPIPTDYDHSRTSKTVWGAVTDLALERSGNGATQLVGNVVVDGPEDAMAIALPRLRTGSARFSVDARIHKPLVSQGGRMLATDWEPMLVSLVAAGQDTHAVMRGSTTSGEPSVTDNEQAGGDPVTTEAQATATTPVAPVATPEPPVEQVADLQRSAFDERRELNVRRAASHARLDEATITRILTETKGRPETEAMIAVVREHQRFVEATAPTTAGHPARIEVTRDGGDTLMRAFNSELERRTGVINAPTDESRQAYQMTCLEMCRSYLGSRGVDTLGMSKNQIVQRAFHSTSDFPQLFANVANKTLLAAYAEEPQTWAPLARQRNLPDFKQVTDLQLAGQIVPEKILEGGEYKSGTLTEGKATWNLATFGKRIAVTRQAIINDDLDSLSRVPELLGRGCRLLESNMVWELLTTGASGSIVSLDGQALFHSSHNNTISGSTTVISIAGMDAAKVKLRKQTDLAGNRLNLAPAFLVVPPELETTALQFLFPTGYAPTSLTGSSGPNPFASGVQLIVEPRLSDDSNAFWYLTSAPNRVEMITYGYLAGEAGPTITTTEQRNPDGVELLVRMDFGCTLSDYRGFVRSAGA
jgi:hypothetical protein